MTHAHYSMILNGISRRKYKQNNLKLKFYLLMLQINTREEKKRRCVAFLLDINVFINAIQLYQYLKCSFIMLCVRLRFFLFCCCCCCYCSIRYNNSHSISILIKISFVCVMCVFVGFFYLLLLLVQP